MEHLELIGKYLTNESSAEENELLLAWITSSPENKQEFLDTCNIWHASTIPARTFDYHKAYQSFKEKQLSTEKQVTAFQSSQTKIISLWRRLSIPVAAALLLSVGALYLFKPHNKNITYANNTSVTKSYTLPDGTVVFLNKNASITLPEAFEGNTRNVSMTGEIFYDVKKNPGKPFIIEAGTGKVTVRGTSFNVDYNKKDTQCEVIVATGVVELKAANNALVTLTPNERGLLEMKNNSLRESINEDVNYLSWKTGVLSFKNSSYKQVFSDLERHYGITIQYPNDINPKLALTATFNHEELQSALNVVEMMFNIKISKQNSIFVVRNK